MNPRFQTHLIRFFRGCMHSPVRLVNETGADAALHLLDETRKESIDVEQTDWTRVAAELRPTRGFAQLIERLRNQKDTPENATKIASIHQYCGRHYNNCIHMPAD